MKRFKIVKDGGMNFSLTVFRGDTTQECYDFLKINDEEFIANCKVEDLEDEIFVDATEFKAAFDEEENPEDLQWF